MQVLMGWVYGNTDCLHVWPHGGQLIPIFSFFFTRKQAGGITCQLSYGVWLFPTSSLHVLMWEIGRYLAHIAYLGAGAKQIKCQGEGRELEE